MRTVATVLSENVDARREELGLSWVDLQSRAHVGRTTITRVQKAQNPTIEVVEKLARALQTTPDALMRDQQRHRPTVIANTPATYNARPGYIRIPRLNVEASAGKGRINDSPVEVLDHLDVLETWARQVLGIINTQSLRVIGVRGDSMSPTINHNDLAFVNVDDRSFAAEGIFALLWQDQVLIKRLRAEPNDRVGIVSDNPAYPPQHIDAANADDLVISGRVVGWWTLRRY